MLDIREIDVMLREREQKIRDLQAELVEAQVYAKALRDILARANKPEAAPTVAVVAVESESKPEFRGQSVAARAYAVLKQHGRPLHTTDIARRMGASTDKERRDLSGTLAHRARRGKVFRRTKPGTFGLLEWDQAPSGLDSDLHIPAFLRGVEGR